MSEPTVWLDGLSKEVLQKLNEKYYRPFAVIYSEPHVQDGKKISEAFYNDIVLNQLKSLNPKIRHSPRFGFRVRRLYDFNDQTYKIWAGFDMNNKVLAMNSFIKGMKSNKKALSLQINDWLQKQAKTSWLWFGQNEENYIWEQGHSAAKIQKELSKYAGTSHSLNELYIDAPGVLEGAEFTIERELKKFRGISEKDLKAQREALAKSLMATFKELYFLYYHLFTINSRNP